MKISRLIEELKRIRKEVGDVEVTITGAGPDCPPTRAIPTVYETTVEKLQVRTENTYPSRNGTLGTRLRLWW